MKHYGLNVSKKPINHRNHDIESIVDAKWITAELHHKHTILTKAWSLLCILICRGRNRLTLALSFWKRKQIEHFFDRWRNGIFEKRKRENMRNKVEQFHNTKLITRCFATFIQNAKQARMNLLRAIRWESRILTPKTNYRLISKSLDAWKVLVLGRSFFAKSRFEERIKFSIFQEWKMVPRDTVAKKNQYLNMLAAQFRWRVLCQGVFSAWKNLITLYHNALCHSRIKTQNFVWRLLLQFMAHRRRTKRNLVGALHLWASKTQRKYFNQWYSIHKSNMRLKEISNMIITRKSDSIKSKSLDTWRKQLHFLKGIRVLQKVASQKQLNFVLTVWKQHTSYTKAITTMAFMHANLMRRIGFWRWIENYQASLAEESASFHRNVCHMNQFRVRLAFNTLKTKMYESAMYRVNRDRAIRKHINHVSFHCFSAWYRFTHRKMMRHAYLLKAELHRQTFLVSGAFRCWQRYHDWFVQEKQKLIESFKHARIVLCRRILCIWRRYCVSRVQKRELRAHAIVWRRNTMLRAGISCWLTNATQASANEERKRQQNDSIRAQRISKLVAKIAFHWRNQTLRHRTKQCINSRPPIHSSHNLSASSRLHQSTISASLSRVHLTKVSETHTRPQPRRLSEDMMMSTHYTRSKAGDFAVSRVSDAASSLWSSSIVSRDVNNTSPEKMTETLSEFQALKMQVKKDHAERSQLRNLIRSIRANEEFNDPESLARCIERLSELQSRKLAFESKRAAMLPLIRSCIETK